jgi:myo-inositol-1(or 4)-monophosphatase
VDGERATLNERTQLDELLVEINLGAPEQHRAAGGMVDALLPSVRDLRRGGSAAASLACVADGRADAVWSPGIKAWDGAAGLLLVLESGGTVGDLDGECGDRFPASGDVLAAHPAVWKRLQGLLAPAYALTRR